MHVEEGETVVLLGTNGNGKSTLMKCIMGIVRPDAGEIYLETDGRRIDVVGKRTEEIVQLGIALVPEADGSCPSSPSRRTCCSARTGATRARPSPGTWSSAARRSRCSSSGGGSSPAA